VPQYLARRAGDVVHPAISPNTSGTIATTPFRTSSYVTCSGSRRKLDHGWRIHDPDTRGEGYRWSPTRIRRRLGRLSLRFAAQPRVHTLALLVNAVSLAASVVLRDKPASAMPPRRPRARPPRRDAGRCPRRGARERQMPPPPQNSGNCGQRRAAPRDSRCLRPSPSGFWGSSEPCVSCDNLGGAAVWQRKKKCAGGGARARSAPYVSDANAGSCWLRRLCRRQAASTRCRTLVIGIPSAADCGRGRPLPGLDRPRPSPGAAPCIAFRADASHELRTPVSIRARLERRCSQPDHRSECYIASARHRPRTVATTEPSG